MKKVTRRPGGIVIGGDRVAALDRAFMERALELAARGRGRTHPNPMVGCVIVRDGRIIGEGYHERAGEAHAEVQAVRNAGGPSALAGATVYVTLEPCAHHGRTPPCVDLLLSGSPAEVVIAMEDPHPQVAGRGVGRLRAAGIPVVSGVCAEAAWTLNEAWLTSVQQQRPFFALKYAMTLDGKVASRSGHARWITGTEARAYVHELRDRYDAILVGAGTALADDPLLTCRRHHGRDPIRVLLDGRARLFPDAAMLQSGSAAPTWIFVGSQAPTERCRSLERAGAEVIPTRQARGGMLDLVDVCRHLRERSVVSVLVEGGARVNRSFVEAGLVDKLYLFLGARSVDGDDAPGPIAGTAALSMEDARSWAIRQAFRVGQDLCCEVYPCGRSAGKDR